jgi:protein PhnA
MSDTGECPQCGLGNIYPDGALTICADCGFEWTAAESDAEPAGLLVRDANGNLLADGDSVSLIKDLKPKGGSSVLKIGTRFKNIRLVEGDHDVDVGDYMLKSAFLKKQS